MYRLQPNSDGGGDDDDAPCSREIDYGTVGPAPSSLNERIEIQEKPN